MRITDVEVISFRIPTRQHATRWSYSVFDGEQHFGIQRVTKISTDDGAVGFAAGARTVSCTAPRTRKWRMSRSHCWSARTPSIARGSASE